MKTTFFKTIVQTQNIASLPLLRRGLGGGLFAVLLIALAMTACKDEDDEAKQQGNLKIDLLTPKNNAQVLPDDLPLSFTWKKSEGVGATTLYISTVAAFPDGDKTLVHEAGEELSYALGEAQYDALLAAGGTDYGDQATVHWKVAAAAASAAEGSFKAYRKAQPSITLVSTHTLLDANALTDPPTFAWTKVPEVTAYTIKFSTGESFPNGATTKAYDAGDEASYAFASVDAFDQLLKDIGVTTQKTVYWTAVPTTPDASIRLATPGSFTAVRLSRLKAPAYGAAAIVTADLTGDFVMEWQPEPNAASYEVVIARDEDLADVLITKTASAATLSIPWSELQTLITTTSKGLKRYKKNPLYWNVKVNNVAIAETPGLLNLYGQRIYVDNRAEQNREWYPAEDLSRPVFIEPSVTYKVAVLEYNGKEVVWMAEDLQAGAMNSPYETNAANRRGLVEDNCGDSWKKYLRSNSDEGEDCSKCTYTPLPDKYINRTDPPVGGYYDGNYVHAYLPKEEQWNGKWRLPSTEEWQEMFTAARAAYGGSFGDNVIRHPDFCVSGSNTHANEWGMNILANGGFTYGGSCSTHLNWDENDVYYANNNTLAGGEPSAAECIKYNASSGIVEVQTGMNNNGANIRGIYTGDGE